MTNQTRTLCSLPMRLMWAHIGEPMRGRIAPGLYYHCDLLRVIVGVSDKPEPWLQFVTEVSPNRFPSRGGATDCKAAGRVRAQDSAVSASNADTKIYTLGIKWNGLYDPTSDDAMREALIFEGPKEGPAKFV